MQPDVRQSPDLGHQRRTLLQRYKCACADGRPSQRTESPKVYRHRLLESSFFHSSNLSRNAFDVAHAFQSTFTLHRPKLIGRGGVVWGQGSSAAGAWRSQCLGPVSWS